MIGTVLVMQGGLIGAVTAAAGVVVTVFLLPLALDPRRRGV